MEVANYNINKIEILDEDSNKWKELDKESFNQYSEEIYSTPHFLTTG